ncbi:unnamed protein product [Polarella glacialis]|uniref:C3H1-type domain-containing protein n=1 Tax=Polarella glacialis TaxID=89957 RepID=A0A813HT79_POLGL|nr:unnamed protein product [Polarella glacialis]
MQTPFKRTLCRHHQQGRCDHGSACSFAHGTEELQKHIASLASSKPQPEERRLKTQICLEDKAGYCCRGEACWFAHGEEQLRNFRTDFKSKLCDFHEALAGSCSNGAACRWAHGQDELRGRNSAASQKEGIVAAVFGSRVTAEDHPRGYRAALPEGTEPSNVPVQPAVSEHRQEQPGAAACGNAGTSEIRAQTAVALPSAQIRKAWRALSLDDHSESIAINNSTVSEDVDAVVWAANGHQIQHSLDAFPPLQPARQPAGEPAVQSPAQTASRPPTQPPPTPPVALPPEQPPAQMPFTTAAGSLFPEIVYPFPLTVFNKLQEFVHQSLPRLQFETLRALPCAHPGVKAWLPVPLLRWTHDGINSRMVFGQGRRQDSSIYDVVHDLFSGRLKPSELPPLKVVLDGNDLYVLNNRRLAALKMYQALTQHEVVCVPCELFQPSHPEVKSWYTFARTTTAELGNGFGIRPHGDRAEAWHMGEPLFRRPQEWCDAGTSKAPLLTEETIPHESRGTNPFPSPASASTDLSPDRSSPLPAMAPDLPRPKHIFKFLPDVPPKAPPKSKPELWLLDGQAGLPAESKFPSSPNCCLGTGEILTKAPPAGFLANRVPSQELSIASQVPPGPPPQIPTKAAPILPTVQAIASQVPLGPPPQIPTKAAPILLIVQAIASQVPPSLPPQIPTKAAPILPTAQAIASQVPNGPPPQIPIKAAPILPIMQSSQIEMLAVFPPQMPQHIIPKMPVKAVPPALSKAPPPGLSREASIMQPPPLLVHLPSTTLEQAGQTIPEDSRRSFPQHALHLGTPPKAFEAHLGPATSEVSVEIDPAQFSTSEDCKSDEVLGMTEFPSVLAETANQYASSCSELSGRDDDSDDGDGSAFEMKAGDADSEDGGEKKCHPTQKYATASELDDELRTQKNIRCISDLKNKLVCGTFRCLSGSDFKNRRCRGQVLVEAGPKAMLGCRVHIHGCLNRNRAWDFDKCWVRILQARVEQLPGQTSAAWSASAAEATVLLGTVVRAEEQAFPRQRLVVCLRSKFVRSLKSMVFRPINGKFPLVKVPWMPQQPLPSLFDLHVVEITNWTSIDFPVGRHVEVLNMQRRGTDLTVLYAVQRSLNYCDWEDPAENHCPGGMSVPVPVALAEEFPSPEEDERRSGRTNLCHSHAVIVSIEQEGWPVSTAFAMPSPAAVHVHIVDVNAYLDSCCDAIGQQTDATARKRAVGAWFKDYLGNSAQACLPLMPTEIESQISFAVGVDRKALTIVLPIHQVTGEVDFSRAQHFESVVRCKRVCSFAEAEEMISCSSSSPSPETDMLQALSKVAAQCERSSLERGASTAFEHWEPELSPKGGQTYSSHAARLVGCLSYLANAYAGQVLSDASLWDQLQQPSEAISQKKLSHGLLMPIFYHGRPDTLAYRSAHRLLKSGPVLSASSGFSTLAVTKVLRRILAAPGLSSDQQQALQKAFLRQLCNSFPSSGYLLAKGPAWPPASSTSGAPHMQEGQLFHRGPATFHVTAPLRRYIDILGHRALKWALGWRPRSLWLRPTAAQLAEAVARTTARFDACRFAGHIFRQISLMRDLNNGSWRIDNAVVGNVGPASFELLVPLPSSTHLGLTVPVSALRGASCSVEFDSESHSLNVSCFSHSGCQASTQGRASWRISPWGGTRLSCVVSRNFAQPVPHHASANAVIPSEVTFEAKVGQQPTDVCIGVGHRMYPEVFSEWPDLKDMHLLEKDVNAYARIWHNVRMCQTHAAATVGASDTPRTCARSLLWHTVHGKQHIQCNIAWPGNSGEALSIAKGDLAILRCAVPSGREAIIYGKVHRYVASQEQFKTRLCGTSGCKSSKCPFAHGEQERHPVRFKADIELSDISEAAVGSQRQLLDEAYRMGDGAFDIQFIVVPSPDRRNLEQVQCLPQLLKAKGGSSPIIAYLTRLQAPEQKQEQQETRTLANTEQVEQALSYPWFRVHGLPLNDVQLLAVRIGLQRPFSLVQGPPGTGKTTFLVHMVTSILNLEADPTVENWQQVNRRRSNRESAEQEPGRILVCTPSNQAADECLKRLAEQTTIPQHFITRVYARSIEAQNGSRFRGGALIDGRSDFTIRSGLEEHALHFKVRQRSDLQLLERTLPQHSSGHVGANCSEQTNYDEAYQREEVKVLLASRVIVATCGSACVHSALCKKSVRTVNFATVIVDEAAQATEPDVVLPALLAEQRVVIVGDHKQLGPVVTESNLCRAYLGMLETPMLERLYKSTRSTMLDKQYRMHPSIRSFPSDHFYESRLQDDLAPLQRALGVGAASIWPRAEERVVFVDCQHPHAFGTVTDVGYGRSMTATLIENNTSLVNSGEGNLVVEAYERLLRDGTCKAGDIAIITPYRAQQQYIQQKLQELPGLGAQARDTAVGTVYSLQGSERDFVLLSFVRSTAEGTAIMHGPFAAASVADIRVSVSEHSAALRQTCETHLGIVSNSKLLNVSLTRAKCGLVCVGNKAVLCEGSEDFYRLAMHLAGRGCILPEEQFRRLGRT